jgi:hypothetical protein
MRIFFKKVWVKVKLTVIIILSITIGASYAIAIPQYLEIRKAADETWTHVQQIQEQRKENKNVVGEASVKAASYAQPEEATEDQIAVASPSGVAKIIYETAQKRNFPDPGLLVRIAQAESSFNTCTKNPNSSAIGVFQILDMHGLSREERCNPEIATIWAVEHFNNGNPWNSSRSKWQ